MGLHISLNNDGATDMNVPTIGIDLAKSVFQVHGIDKDGKTVIQKRMSRSKLLEFLFNYRLT